MSDTGFLFIPEHIMERDDLTLQEKCVYGRIIGLTKAEGFCYASNEWLGQKLGLSADMVSKYISRLSSKKLLVAEVSKVKKGENENPNEWGTRRKIYVFLPPDSDGYRVKSARGTDFTPSIVIEKESTAFIDTEQPIVKTIEDLPIVSEAMKERAEQHRKNADRKANRPSYRFPSSQGSTPRPKFEKREGVTHAEDIF